MQAPVANLLMPPSVQALRIGMLFGDKLLATGTGFVVSTSTRAYLMTNRHNVTGRHNNTNECLHPTKAVPDRVVIAHNAKEKLGKWITKEEPLYDTNGAPRWHEHPVLRHRADFVALPLENTGDVELFSVDLDGEEKLLLMPTSEVSVVGFPFGMAAGGSLAIWATGSLASEPSVDYDNLPIQLIDCRSREGQSGSPVIAFRPPGTVPLIDGSLTMQTLPCWRFVGIYSGRIHAESDIGIVWKTKALKELVATL